MSKRESPIFINRELSWLEFNRRVLACSREGAVPLGEQLNFAKIYGSNLDEFFMVRVGSLYDQTLLKSTYKENKTGMTPQEQLDAIMPKVADLQQLCDESVATLEQRLEEYGIRRVQLGRAEKKDGFWKKYFLRELFPVLSPQIIGQRHPFPFIRDREMYVGLLLKEPKSEAPVFGLIPISGHLNRVILHEGSSRRFALVEDVILHYAEAVFGKVTVLERCIFRVTRNADINVEEGMFDHDIDYRAMMSELLKKRRKLAAVRLQFLGEAPEGIRSLLLDKLLLPAGQCFVQRAPLELSYLGRLADLLPRDDASHLFYPIAKPLQPPVGFSLYETVRGGEDVLVNYPYHSFRPFLKLLRDAGRDPDVISIKMTLYRVASESQVINALIEAAENGKEVVTIVELRARFDEQNNIDWSRELEDAGCTVIYGFSDYKVHSKLTLITRKAQGRYEYVSSIGTGNYNERTSELYTDLAFFTARQHIGEEVATVFNDLALGRHTEHVDQLIVAPLHFKQVLLREMREEMRFHEEGGEARIVLKCNSISDKNVIETLSEASITGVPVDLIVRGICCLQAGLPGYTENITVRSLVGRFLEHSRIYAFGKGERQRIYIASGDFLTRNTERRVEVGVRIDDPQLKQVLNDILQQQLKDTANTSIMQPNGSYRKQAPPEGEAACNSQMQMYSYFSNYARRRLEQRKGRATATSRPSAWARLGKWWKDTFGA